MKTTIQVVKDTVDQIYAEFNNNKVSQGEAIAQIHSVVSILERCVNKLNIPGNGMQDKNLQKKADKQFPDLEILTLNLKPDATGERQSTLFTPPLAAYTDPKGDIGSLAVG